MQSGCVIVAYHRPEQLRALLEQLQEIDDLVVVNVEDDPAVAAAARGATVVPLRANPGYAAAVNAGVAAGTAPVVVFMNDDVLCGTRDVVALARAIGRGCDVALPRVVDGEGTTRRTIAALPGAGALLKEWAALPDRPVAAFADRLHVEKWRMPLQPERVQAGSASVVAARRDLLESCPLPEDYFLYWEESEWFFRLAQLDACVEYHPEATVVHRGGRDDVRPEKARLLARNAVRCVRRTRGRGGAMAAYPVVVLWWTRLLVVDAIAALVRRRGWATVRARSAGWAAALAAWTELR
jgi:GT2 family glycosyltransferase